MKKMNKVIAAMTMMAITFAMPAMAGHKTTVSTSRQPNNHGKNDKVVVVNNDKKGSHFDKADKKTSHFDTHKTHAYRPDVKTCTIKVSRHDSHKKVVAKVENIRLQPATSSTSWHSCHSIYNPKGPGLHFCRSGSCCFEVESLYDTSMALVSSLTVLLEIY